MKSRGRWNVAVLGLLLAWGATPALGQGSSGPPAGSPTPSGAQPAQPAASPRAASPAPKPTEKPAPAKSEGGLIDLLIAAAVAAVVSGGVAFGVVYLTRNRGSVLPESAAGGATGAEWSGFDEFRENVLGVLKLVRSKAGNLDSVPRLTVQDWSRDLAKARATLERAPLTRADHEPLRKLWVDVSKMGQEMTERARPSSHGDELSQALLSFTQALSRRAQDAARSESSGAAAGGGVGGGGVGAAELHRLEEQVERGTAGLADQYKQISARLQKLEERPAPSLGQLVEEEFRTLCEGRAADLEKQLAGGRGPSGAPKPPPPAVAAALRVADAALKVSEEALRAKRLNPGVKAQLTNLATLAGTLQAMCPVSTDPQRPPSVDGIRGLPERPEAAWQPEMVARGGSVINAVTAYWSEVNRLLQAETARIEQWLHGAGQDHGAHEAAIGEWLGSRLLPLLDQAATAIQEDGPVRREAREVASPGLISALDELHRACGGAIDGTGLEPRLARKGDLQRPEAGVKIDHSDGGQPPETVLEVRQCGWTWQGRLLRELHVVVQDEGHPAPAPVPAAAPSGSGPVPPDDGAARVRRL